MDDENQLKKQVISSSATCSILMYSHDGFGLGHLKRNFNIAREALRVIPGSQSLLIMGHCSVPFHPIPKGIDFVKLPSIVKVENEHWVPRGLSMSDKEFKGLRSGIIRTTAEYYRPDIFLVDYVPKGVWGELIPTLKFLKKQGTTIILGLRDIIDDPKTTCARWRHGKSYEIMRKYYDKILIYGTPEVYDTARNYGLTGDLGEKVEYCGYLTYAESFRCSNQVRQELLVEDEKLIVITAGGGGDAYPMMKKSLEAVQLLQGIIRIKVVLVTGPLMALEQREHLKKMAEDLPVVVMTSTHGITDYMNAADLLITMASYNTLMESVRLQKPILVIPREGPSAEQRMRAKIFNDLGYVRSLEPAESLSATELKNEILGALEDWVFPLIPLNMSGLENALLSIKNCRMESINQTFMQSA